MSPIASLPDTRRHRTLRWLPFDWRWLPVAAVVLIVLGVLIPALQSDHFVDHVQVTNNSEFDVTVAVAGAQPDGWTDLGTAVAHQASVIHEVFDEGNVWTFDFATPAAHARLQLTRDQLDRAGWNVTVPGSLIAQLRASGAPPSANFTR
jgi:hypothetical protein